ncbi:hypothetical protein FNV43_RR07746 [Rhamnella rubrinervis]|uniref:Cysteine-rich receptor-like protein kinase 29 n=1 Tax=Rhamnella rubrinervis TaxID=2594499 RepID=A0A8K0HFB0_9ROSA|nr:hypothetical protein FNV43_RR07746 [Rhamnella rubrinervis]
MPLSTSSTLLCSIVIIYIHLLQFLTPTTPQSPDFRYNCSSNGNSTTTNITSAYRANLNSLLSSLSSNNQTTIINNHGFYTSSLGDYPNTVNLISLCRGDIDPENCQSCVKKSTAKIVEVCPQEMEAVIWFDVCMLRYSNRFIFGIMEIHPTSIGFLRRNVSDVDEFYKRLGTLLSGLRSRAASGGSDRKFAADSAVSDLNTIYALVQCTPDLEELDCSECLEYVASAVPNCCYGREGIKIFTPSCNLRVEPYRFFAVDPQLAPPPVLDEPSVKGNKSRSDRTIIIIVVAVVIAVMLGVTIWSFFRNIKKPKEIPETVQEISAETIVFDFGTIRDATSNFSDENKLGQGGFGVVYKGKLSSGQLVAVKRLSRNSGQGDIEFKNEVVLVAKLQHRNLVRLLGYCLEGSERLLVYEFVPNGSLDHFIFDPIRRVVLDWDRRHKIIGGIARGLLYLHEDSRLRIVHRDLKASNILLDAEMNPKISDFGMARLFALDQTQSNTSRIVGTYGYMAPEYAFRGQVSVKSDVFSFGVLVLEIISGLKNNSFGHDEDNIESLLSHAWKNWNEGTSSNLVDPILLTSDSSRTETMRCIQIGLLCVQENVAERPTMASVVLMLNSLSLTTLPPPSHPAFVLMQTSSPGSDTNSGRLRSRRSNYVQESADDASITSPYPR